MGNKALKSITHNDIDSLVNQMKAEGLAPRTQEYAVGTFFRIWKHAAKRKLVSVGDNPAADVEIEKVDNPRTRVLTPKELNSILDQLAIVDRAAYQITKFCAFTGCRFSEAANLKFEFVCFEKQRVLFLDTKNKESREMYLGDSLIELLKQISPGPVGAYVFVKKDGTPFREPPSAFKTTLNLPRLKPWDSSNRARRHTRNRCWVILSPRGSHRTHTKRTIGRKSLSTYCVINFLVLAVWYRQFLKQENLQPIGKYAKGMKRPFQH